MLAQSSFVTFDVLAVALSFGHYGEFANELLRSIRECLFSVYFFKFSDFAALELIAREINSLKMMTAIKSTEKETKHKLELDNKAWFLLITKILLIMFDGLGAHPGTADEALKDALESD